jgi:glycosyltransferase involved in cell wall biosynthesis
MNKEYILFTSSNFPIGGSGASYVNLFCRGVKDNNGEIRVYLFKGSNYEDSYNSKYNKNITEYGVKYNYIGFSTRSKINILKLFEDFISVIGTFILMFRLLFKRTKIIILVYSNAAPFNIPVYFFSKFFRIKIISFVPEYLESDEIKKMNLFQKIKTYSFLINYNFLNKLSDKLIVFSAFSKNEYIKKGFDSHNIHIQPNLNDLKGWYISDEDYRYTIGYAGTPSKKDGVTDLMHAVKILKEKGIIIKVLIVGDSMGKESLIPRIQKISEEIGIAEQMTFTGLVPHEAVKKYLNMCQILSLTRPDIKQTQVGFPSKLGEYIACKRVVLATRVGDIEYYFSDKNEIVLAEPGNASSIAESILWILNNNDKVDTIVENAFIKASVVLDYKIGVKRIMNFLSE